MPGFEKNRTSASADDTDKPGLFKRLREGLSRTRHNLSDGLADLVQGSKSIDDGLLEDIETQLLVADVGIEATREIIDGLTELELAIRPDQPAADLERLAPHLTAALGADHTRAVIQRQLDRTQRPGSRKRLRQLLRN